jgi:hypothetical protein
MKKQLWTVACVALMFGGVRADDQPDARAILDRAMKAMGGEAKLAKLGTVSGKVKISVLEGGQEFTIDLDGTWQGLRHYRADVQFQANGQTFTGILVFNGDKGWFKKMDKAEAAPEGVVPFVQNFLYAGRMPQLLPLLKDKAYKLAPLGEIKVDGRDAVGISISHKDHKDVSLFFDKENGWPVKSEIRLQEPQSNKDITVDYRFSNYKEFDGLKVPAKMALKVDDKDFNVEVSHFKAVEKVDDSQFDMP